MTDPRVPTALVERIRRDLRPVRPLASPARRTLLLLPLGALLLVGVLVVWGFRQNLSLLTSARWGSHCLGAYHACRCWRACWWLVRLCASQSPERTLTPWGIAATLGLSGVILVGVPILTMAALGAVVSVVIERSRARGERP